MKIALRSESMVRTNYHQCIRGLATDPPKIVIKKTINFQNIVMSDLRSFLQLGLYVFFLKKSLIKPPFLVANLVGFLEMNYIKVRG